MPIPKMLLEEMTLQQMTFVKELQCCEICNWNFSARGYNKALNEMPIPKMLLGQMPSVSELHCWEMFYLNSQKRHDCF